jgi:hypothetical protein
LVRGVGLKASYTVQVKSEHTWLLEGKESVDWLIKHPLPLFLGVMDKASLKLRLYHTAPRSYVWTTGEVINRMEITMTDDTTGQNTQWVDDYKFSLAPILCIDMATLANDDKYYENASNVLEFWIDIENRNLTRIKTGIYGWEMPDKYHVNVVPKTARVMQWRAMQSEELLHNLLRHVCECLEYLGAQFHYTGKFVGAVEVALLYRYLRNNCTAFTGNERNSLGALSGVIHRLNELPLAKEKYVFSGVDALQEVLEKALRDGIN